MMDFDYWKEIQKRLSDECLRNTFRHMGLDPFNIESYAAAPGGLANDPVNVTKIKEQRALERYEWEP